MERMLLFIYYYYYLCSIFSRVYFEFILNQGKPTETKYEFSPREPFRGPIEYNKSYLQVNNLRKNNLFFLFHFF